ncbi:hypothetical protein AAFC00_000445 [Neodothiora populina]|uniref:DUF3752 domain-containing protein n=1 Tax=Neodothiora populina TaxID=2781224 RepID=A0ABR3PCZ0_9PEZI
MSAIGASLPPHLLAKRKRQQEESSQDDHDITPGAKKAKSPGAEETQGDKRPRVAGPAPPVLGPTPPPAPLDQRPSHPANSDREDDDSSSDDDDDFGPAPPSAKDLHPGDDLDDPIKRPTRPGPDEQPTKARRDEWMMVPPTADDLSARLDPTKIRAKGFNTGKSARAPADKSGGMAAAWTETPEEKLKRLQNEAMGVKGSAAGDFNAKEYARNREQHSQADKIKEQTQAYRGPSLVEQHRKVQKVEDDDPSKRAFDREKDIGGGGVSRVQRNEMLKKAGDFSTKFSGGGYL